MSLIYVAHPYGGKKINKDDVERIIIKLIEQYPDDTFVSPIHALDFAYDLYPYEQGLKMCLDILNRCDKMFVFGDYIHSVGVTAEIKYCQSVGKPYVIFKGI